MTAEGVATGAWSGICTVVASVGVGISTILGRWRVWERGLSAFILDVIFLRFGHDAGTPAPTVNATSEATHFPDPCPPRLTDSIVTVCQFAWIGFVGFICGRLRG